MNYYSGLEENTARLIATTLHCSLLVATAQEAASRASARLEFPPAQLDAATGFVHPLDSRRSV
jgi:hypothetical protein